MNLLERLTSATLTKDETAIAFLGQAGFILRTFTGTTLAVDPYLGNICEQEFGFKRLIPPPMKPEEMKVRYFAATHAHRDHLDPAILQALPPDTVCIGSMDCAPVYQECGIAPGRLHLLRAGETCVLPDFTFRAIYADHGELAPDAVGFFIEFESFCFYVVGDTAYRPEKIKQSLGAVKVDGMFVPINPAFGNPGAENSVKMGALVKPHFLAAVHFGMFAEHGGDPAEFLRKSSALPAEIQPFVPKAGDICIYSRKTGLRRLEV